MSTHFKWYPSSEDVTVPWNARYSFPSQANKAEKMTPRIPPKNGAVFGPGGTILLEFPAQGYVNPLNTTIEFDVALQGFGTPGNTSVRFENNIQSIFSRVRLLYGGTPLEDILNYNQIVRCLTTWTSTSGQVMDQTAVAEGIGGAVVGFNTPRTSVGPDTSLGVCGGFVNVRQKYIQGIGGTMAPEAGALHFTGGANIGNVGGVDKFNSGDSGTWTCRRYQVSLALGLFTQDKLIPTKFMASQLAIELTLETPEACIYATPDVICGGAVAGSGTNPTYKVGNVNLIPEILQFDSSYDAMFLKGLREGGVPIKFSSWHTFQSTTAGSATVSMQIQERSRSIKSLFVVQKRFSSLFNSDSGATFFDTSSNTQSTLQNYQFRIGGRYFPAAPVQTSLHGASHTNGGAEAYVELAKALNIVGDYRLSTGVSPICWAVPPVSMLSNAGGGAAVRLPEYDYSSAIKSVDGTTQVVTCQTVESAINSFCGSMPSCQFAMAISLETSNGVEISGLNAEEQSDISLIANWSSAQTLLGTTGAQILVFSYYDAMIILRENNILELIQ